MEEALKQNPSTCLKIVLFGPESTGKTTLAKQLATYFNEPWVEEYMREYLQKKWDETQKKCSLEDLLPIAKGQMLAENTKTTKAKNVIFCDTNLEEIKVYSEYYYDGFCPSQIKKYALKNTYDLYFLTYIDTNWIFDDLRDRPDDRLSMFCTFEQELIENKRPYLILKGTQENRFKIAVKTIEELLKKKN